MIMTKIAMWRLKHDIIESEKTFNNFIVIHYTLLVTESIQKVTYPTGGQANVNAVSRYLTTARGIHYVP